MIAAAIRTNSGLPRTDFLDIYRNPVDGRVYPAVLAPLKGTSIDFVLALRIDPE